MKKIILTLLALIMLTMAISCPALAENPDIPDRMRVGVIGKCGDMFEFRLAAVPVLTYSIDGFHPKSDLNFLILRVSIKNLTGSPVTLAKDSFLITEVYNDIYYGEYVLDKSFTYYSALIGNTQFAYDDPIQPGEDRPTTLVFQVYPNIKENRYPTVTGWVLTFTPPVEKGSGESCTLRFLLPEAERY